MNIMLDHASDADYKPGEAQERKHRKKHENVWQLLKNLFLMQIKVELIM